MSPKTILVWFRNDLRTHDHAPLLYASQQAEQIIPFYCFHHTWYKPHPLGFPRTGPFRARFLLESLEDLRAQMQEKGSDLLVKIGRTVEHIEKIAEQYPLEAVYFHKEHTAEEVAIERILEQRLAPKGIKVQGFHGNALYHPNELPFSISQTPDVFTQFRYQVEEDAPIQVPHPSPSTLPPLPMGLEIADIPTLQDLGLSSPKSEPRSVLDFRGGERAALQRLHHYFWETDRIRMYKETRNGMVDANDSSKFAPWLAAGCLSPRYINAELERYEEKRIANESTYWMFFELLWREYFRCIAQKYGTKLFHAAGFQRSTPPRWAHDKEAFAAWREGKTGIPFVDANMLELKKTGFMSNRGRQNVASFLTKYLSIDWRWGAAYFESQLIDYDVASNWGNWAYVAGVGNDPRDRYFHIARQANQYDPQGTYVKRWLPVLERTPASFVHEPHKIAPIEAITMGLRLGENYPPPMIPIDQVYKKLQSNNAKRPKARR